MKKYSVTKPDGQKIPCRNFDEARALARQLNEEKKTHEYRATATTRA